MDITADAAHTWFVNDEERPEIAGCIDIDLNFSPVTNTLPIRRLNLAVGQNAKVRSAWLRFPDFELKPLEQTYTRTDETHYRYESASGFMRDLEVNEFGFVTEYPDFWQIEKG